MATKDMALCAQALLVFILMILKVHIPATLCDVQINSTLNFGHVRVGEVLNVTCITRGSDRLTWTSSQYIGHNSLTLVLTGSRISPNSYTTATLVKKTPLGEAFEMVSELSIIVQPDIPSASLTCHNDVTRETQTINFSPVDNPIIMIEVHESYEVCPRQTFSVLCDSRGTSTLSWISATGNGLDNQIMTLSANNPLDKNSTITAQITENNVTNGIQVLKSRFTIVLTRAFPKNLRHYITCVNEQLRSEHTIALRMSDNCTEMHTTSADVQPKTTTSPSTSLSTSMQTTTEVGCMPVNIAGVNDHGGVITAAVVVPVVIIVLAIAIYFAVYTYMKFYRNRKRPARVVQHDVH